MEDHLKTPPTMAYLRQHREQILALAEQYGAYNVRVFGSVARGEATSDSDVDLLVSFREGTSLFELSSFWQDLQELLGIEINVISEGGLTPRFRSRIESDLIAL